MRENKERKSKCETLCFSNLTTAIKQNCSCRTPSTIPWSQRILLWLRVTRLPHFTENSSATKSPRQVCEQQHFSVRPQIFVSSAGFPPPNFYENLKTVPNGSVYLNSPLAFFTGSDGRQAVSLRTHTADGQLRSTASINLVQVLKCSPCSGPRSVLNVPNFPNLLTARLLHRLFPRCLNLLSRLLYAAKTNSSRFQFVDF